MKILVTGGAGFIDYNLCEALLKRGDDITCLDNLSTGKRVIGRLYLVFFVLL